MRGSAIENLRNAFGVLGIGTETVGLGEFAIGIEIPRGFVHDEIGELGMEFVKVKKVILGPFLELVTGSRGEVAVRSISSSNFEALLMHSGEFVLIFSTAVDRILSAYERVQRMRRNHDELVEEGLGEEALAGVAETIRTTIKDEIKALRDELLADPPVPIAPDRENEMSMDLERALNAIANRISRGYGFDPRFGELPAPAPDDPAEPTPEGTRVRAIVEDLRNKQARLTFRNYSGESILNLPEGPAEGEPSEPQEAPGEEPPPSR